jgi:hypothetical protein
LSHFLFPSIRKLSFGFIAVVFLTACGGLKPGGGGRAGKLFEVFYAGDKGTLYFIKPLEFRSGDARLWMDYTLHYRPDSSSEALVNFTIQDIFLHRNLDTVNLVAPGISTPLRQIKLLYNEKSKSGFNSRFSARLPREALYNYLTAASQGMRIANPRSVLTAHDRVSVWQPSPKTERRIRMLQENLLILMAPDTAAMAVPPAGNR